MLMAIKPVLGKARTSIRVSSKRFIFCSSFFLLVPSIIIEEISQVNTFSICLLGY